MTIGKIGKELKKPKTWKKAFKKSGNILQTGGYATIAVGTATGQPEVVALGGSAVGVGKIYSGVARGIKFVDSGNLHQGMKELEASFE